MKKILIGKEGTQPFAINDPNVSRQHAVLWVDEASGQMQIIDNNSTNGTYIYNGNDFVRLFANQPFPVTFDTMIRLGPETRFHIRKLFQTAPPKPQPQKVQKPPQPQKPQPPKRVDIKQLRDISNRYDHTRMELESSVNTVNSMRSLTILVSLAAGTGGKFLASAIGVQQEGASWILGLVIAIVLIISLLSFINIKNTQIIKRRSANERNYAVKYCCPECHFSFKGKIYENILADGRCPKCKVEYYDSSITPPKK